jgi:hypothetical protein
MCRDDFLRMTTTEGPGLTRLGPATLVSDKLSVVAAPLLTVMSVGVDDKISNGSSALPAP